MKQFAMNWGILVAALLVALPTFLVISDKTMAQEWEEDIEEEEDEYHLEPQQERKS
jgi:hypothetical protein